MFLFFERYRHCVFHALVETQHFINLLFNAIRSQSYLPYNTSPPPTSAQPYNDPNPAPAASSSGTIPVPLGMLAPGPSNTFNPRKRGLDAPSDELEHRKGPRLSDGPGYPGRGRGGRGQWDGRGGGRGRGGGQEIGRAHV